MLYILDRLVIVVALGGAFVRLGNFFNSEIYGKKQAPILVLFLEELVKLFQGTPRNYTKHLAISSYFLFCGEFIGKLTKNTM